MSDVHYNLNFEKLCNYLKLGEITGKPEAISGGLLHKMYSITTTSGKYAIKALNPRIMLRPMAFTNFIKSERIVNIAAAVIPALPAKIFNNTCMQEIDKQIYLVFDWADGISFKPNETNIIHSERIGAILADMHMTDFSALRLTNNRSKKEELIDWNFYLVKGKESNAVWVNLLNEVSDKLYDLNTLANDSAKLLSADCVISHRDLEPKNVIWRQNSPLIIDWESAGYINPMQDLIETAVYWSRNKAVLMLF